MKFFPLFLALASLNASAQSSNHINFIRQAQQQTNVVWDMQVESKGAAPSSLTLEGTGSLFQLWTIQSDDAKDYLLDQKLVGAYLPKADVKITTLDPYPHVTRTRVDQPFTVEIQVADLLTGTGLPEAATKVLLEQHIQGYENGNISLDRAVVSANTPLYSAYISQNGPTFLRFPASSLGAADPTRGSGEEHFIVHALADGKITQTQLAAAHVQVWPVASGAIIGIVQGECLHYQIPTLQLNLNDLYPSSDTYLMVYEGTQINGVEGTLVKAFPVDRDRSVTTILEVTELSAAIGPDGTYTVALMSETVYGMELLCDPITFTVKRTIAVNAMQVDFTDGTQP